MLQNYEKYTKLNKLLTFKLSENNIFFLVNKNVIFQNSVKRITSGSVLIRSGVSLSSDKKTFTFISIHKDKLENKISEDDDFGLIKLDLNDIIEKLVKNELQVLGVIQHEPDLEISKEVRKVQDEM
jgi:hypothetical protein